MIAIQYPKPVFKIKTENGIEFIFDGIRKRWLVLTPEEWVRQNFVQFLIQEKKYPSTLIALEKEIKLGELKKRFDILIYNTSHQPNMLVECKGSSITLNEETLQQVLRYNISVPVNYIIITNGNLTYGWEKKNNGLELLNDVPFFG